MSNSAFRACCFAWLLLVSTGCAHAPPPPAPKASLINWSADLRAGSDLWMPQLRERFGPSVVVVSCHGGTRDGHLFLFPDKPLLPMDAEAVAQVMRELYGDRPLVLLSCNPDGKEIRVRGCWYSKSTVSAYPYVGLPGWTNRATGLVEGGPTTRPTTRPEGPLPPK